MVREVVKFESSDGQLFDTKELALAHDQDQLFSDKLKLLHDEYVNKMGYGHNNNFDFRELDSFVKSNRSKLSELFDWWKSENGSVKSCYKSLEHR